MRIVIDATATGSNSNRVYFKNLLAEIRSLETTDQFLVLTTSDYASETLEAIIGSWPECQILALPISGVFTRLIFQQLIIPWILLWWRADVLYSTAHITTLAAPCPTVTLLHDFNIYYDQPAQLGTSGRAKLRLKMLRLLSSWSAKRSRCVIFASDFSRRYIMRKLSLPLSKSRVVYHGVELDRFSKVTAKESYFPNNDNKIILSVSTINPHKNFETLISAFADLPNEQRENTILVIAGKHSHTEYLAELIDLVASYQIKEQVHFLGEVPHSEINQLYAQATVFVFPSRLEVFGIPLIEAMAAGVPVIASNATAIPEVLDQAGILFDVDDVSELTRILSDLLENTEQQQSLCSRGHQRATKFSWLNCAHNTYTVLREAVGNQSFEARKAKDSQFISQE